MASLCVRAPDQDLLSRNHIAGPALAYPAQSGGVQVTAAIIASGDRCRLI